MKRVYLLCGPSLAGKTYLRERMVAALGLRCISFDDLNSKRGLPLGANGQQHEWATTLELALQDLRELLTAGHSVVVDDTFCYRWLRDRFCTLASQLGATPQILHLAVEPALLRERYETLQASRQRAVLAPAAFAAHLDTFEAPSAGEPALRFCTSEAASQWLQELSQSEATAAPLQSGILASPADEMLSEAIARTLELPLSERAALFERLARNIEAFMAAHPQERPWTCTVFTATDGARVFRGGVGHSLVIDPGGRVWRARSYEDFETTYTITATSCEIASLTPLYDQMREYLRR